MPTRPRQRDVVFGVLDNHLVRTVTFVDGRRYEHRCSYQTYETVAEAVDQTPAEGEGVALEPLARSLDLPYTQVNVALEFMKERGVVTTRARRNYPASNFAFLDALIEYHAFREKPLG